MLRLWALWALLGTLDTTRAIWPRRYVNISDEEALQRARQVLASYPLIDGHNDLPSRYRNRVNNSIDLIDLRRNVDDQWGPSSVDIPRLRQGQVGGCFWSTYLRCTTQYRDAVRVELEQIDLVHRMVAKYPDVFTLARTAQDVEDAFAAGRIASIIGIEGGHALDSSSAALRMFYDLGARYLTLTHSCHTPWADCDRADRIGGMPDHNGLTAWGRNLVREMNRIGMIIDLSHVSKATMLDALNVTRAPLIFSHSNAWALCQHSRNVQDDVLSLTVQNNGVVMITFVGFFLGCYPSDNVPRDYKLAADHVEYVRSRTGPDHVGLGSDFDGTTSLPAGLTDASMFPTLIAELVKRGWSDADLQKLAGRNVLRVMRDVEQVKRDLAGGRPWDTWISQEDMGDRSQCRSRD